MTVIYYDCCAHCEHDINHPPHPAPCPDGCHSRPCSRADIARMYSRHQPDGMPDGVLVPAAFSEQVRRDVLAAFGLAPWQAGLAPLPWHVKARARFNRARRRAGELAYRVIAGHPVQDDDDD